MEMHEVLNILNSRRAGTHINICWLRQLETRKDYDILHIQKETITTVRIGIDYNNTRLVQEMRRMGELPPEPQPLSWGEWKKRPHWIQHTDKKTGQLVDYVRLYPSVLPNTPCKVNYFLDGRMVDMAIVQPYCTAKEFPKTEKPMICFTLKANSIQTLG